MIMGEIITLPRACMRLLHERPARVGLPTDSVVLAHAESAPMPLMHGYIEHSPSRPKGAAEEARAAGLHSRQLRVEVTVGAWALPGLTGQRLLFRCKLDIDLRFDLCPASISVAPHTMEGANLRDDKMVSITLKDRAAGYTGAAGRVVAAVEAWANSAASEAPLRAALRRAVEGREQAAQQRRQYAETSDARADMLEGDPTQADQVPHLRERMRGIWNAMAAEARRAAALRRIEAVWLQGLENDDEDEGT